MTQAEVLRRFAEQIPNRRGRQVEYRGSNMFCEPQEGRSVLFSYGHHFPLAVYLGERGGGARVFLKNGDRSSSTTSQHQSSMQGDCDGPTVSFSTLHLAGIGALRVFLPSAASEVTGRGWAAVLLDYTQDGWTHLERTSEAAPWQEVTYSAVPGAERRLSPWVRPRVGMLMITEKKDGGPALLANWHVLGAVLLRTADGRSLLATRDEGTYCVIELSTPARTVAEAIEGLQPREVRQALERGLEVRRQGEWYAIPTALTDRGVASLVGVKTLRELRQRSKQRALVRRFTLVREAWDAPEPRFRQVGAEHILPYVVTAGGYTYGRGSMFHRPGRAGLRQRADHRPLRLGAVWHQIERNTEAASWTAAPGRRFD